MKKFNFIIVLLMICSFKALCIEPVISMTTAQTIGSKFTFQLAALEDNTPIQVDFGNGTLVNFNVNGYYTTISHNLVGTNMIKVYGSGIARIICSSDEISSLNISNAAQLTYLECSDNNLANLDVSANINLTFLSLYNNQLTSLDVTNNIALTVLSIANNQLTQLDVSKNLALTNLNCSNNKLSVLDVSKDTALTSITCSWQSISGLDLSQNSALTELICNNCQLTTLDISKNVLLQNLNCSFNQLDSIDVSKTTALEEINCGNNPIAVLDLSKNSKLKEVSCDNTQIANLDVSNRASLTQVICSNNTQLKSVQCNNDQLGYLDITSDTLLSNIDCSHNQLLSLDLTNDSAITNLSCNYNKLNYATLPLKQVFWINYIYAPQEPVYIVKAISAGYKLDLGNEYKINEDTTVYTWKTLNGKTLIQGIDYIITKGITDFIKAQDDSIYCEMTNPAFPDFIDSAVLKTTNTKVVLYNSIEKSKINGPEVYSLARTIHINSAVKAQLSICDINGRIVIWKFINTGTSVISMRNTGVYFVRLTNGGSSFSRKVFVQ
jgi:hypothetical protein